MFLIKPFAPGLFVCVFHVILCEALEGLADPHTRPVKGPGQSHQHQQQQHGPGRVDARVGLRLHPRPGHKACGGDAKQQTEKKTPQTPPPGIPLTNGGDFPAVRTSGQCPVCKLCPQESVGAVSAGDPRSAGLRFWTRWTWMDRTQVYYPLTVGARAGDPLGGDFADEQTVTGTAHVLLSRWSVFNRRSEFTPFQ